ncbi:MAG: hypothetical protein M4D80_41590 [Myxococcota bacterium]|nr:hypothetical protein [Myxococcota bacterium]
MAIRAVSGDDVVTAARIESDGRFRIALPAGAKYRLEVLTSHGVKQLLAHDDGSWKGLEVKVCAPTAPFDLGGIGDSGAMCDPSDPNCKPGCGDDPPPPCDVMDPTDPNCKPPEPPPPSCGGPNEPPCPTCMDPTDPNCKPPPEPCGGMGEPPCPEDPCTNPMDPNCKPPPCMDPTDPNCMGCNANDPGCGGTTDPICEDPMDPQTCKDPCVIDPMQCGCTTMDPNCWPPPEPPKCTGDTMCDPGDGMTPTNVPTDFGCVMGVGGK